MTIFAEPSEVLCGHRHPDSHAICVARAGHDQYVNLPDYGHQWMPVDLVECSLAGTFTPCQWAEGPFAGAGR